MNHVGYVYPGELPDDMQVMLMDLAVQYGDWPDDDRGMKKLAATQLPLLIIPLDLFPEIDPASEDNDERDFESYLETPLEEYPPVVIANKHFIDGRHRVWAAREQGHSEIRAIDISCLVKPPLPGLGPMKFPRGIRIPKCRR